MVERTVPKHLTPWKPGQSGNPAGRPLGSRNKLAEAFVAAMHDDFLAHGGDVIVKVRKENPTQYLKVIAMIVPKEFHIKDASLEDMSDDELLEILATVRSIAASQGGRKNQRRDMAQTREVGPRKSLN